MKTLSLQKLAALAVICTALACGLSSANAQSISNTGTINNAGTIILRATSATSVLFNTTGTINNFIGAQGGTIRFQDEAPVFENGNVVSNASVGVTNGTIEFTGAINNTHAVFTGTAALGANTGSRIGGIVRYASTDPDQHVQGRYYSNLFVAATGTKIVKDAVFVSGIYDVALATGNRTYFGTFTYDGTSAQTVFPENNTTAGTNRYNNLTLAETGAKTVSGNTDVDGLMLQNSDNVVTVNNAAVMRLLGGVNQPASAGTRQIVVDGAGSALELRGGSSSTANLAAQVIVNNAGNLNFIGAHSSSVANVQVNLGTMLVQSGSGAVNITDLTLADNANAQLQVQNNARLNIAGAYINNHAARVNQLFQPASTVRYEGAGAQNVVNTVAGFPYGNLEVTTQTASAVKTALGDVHVASNFTLSGQANGTGNLDMFTNTGTLVMTTTGTGLTAVTYNGGTEVLGNMRRTIATGENQYRFNNENTIVTFTANTFNGNMTMNVRPDQSPNNYQNTRDVNRKITWSFDNTSNWIATVRVGYKAGDIPGTWPATVTEGTLRMNESETPSAIVQKVATGQPYVRVQNDPIRYVELAGVSAATVSLQTSLTANLPNNFFSGNDILLRGGPVVMASIAHGRWSNPATWDEFREPNPNDTVVVRHTVHVGYERTIDNYTIAEAFPQAMAARVTIENAAVNPLEPLATDASLVFGQDATATGQSLYNLVPNGLFWNRRTETGASADPTAAQNTGTTLFRGLVNYIANTKPIRVDTFVNDGQVQNAGFIEAGQ